MDQGKAIPDSIMAAEHLLREEKETPDALLSAALTLAGHPEGGKLLLNLAAAGKLPAELYKETRLARQIFTHPEREVRVLAGEFFSRPGGHDFSIQRIVEMEGQAGKGKTLFETHCSNCHKIGNMGLDIGPDLKGIRRKFDRVALADAILNPSGAIAFGYEPLLIKTNKDKMYSGFLLSEGQETTVIKDLAGERHTIRTADVLEKTMMNTSLMPDPVALGLKEQDLADVITYLMTL
jgi:putative heme-binding domain-containing protein